MIVLKITTKIKRASRLALVFGLALAVSACNDLHENDQQIITARKATPAFGVSPVIYEFTSASELGHLRRHMRPADFSLLEKSYAVKDPILNARYDYPTKCYTLTHADTPDKVMRYARTFLISRDVVLVSIAQSCVEPGVRTQHAIRFVLKNTTSLRSLGADSFSKSFEQWAAEKSFLYKFFAGVSVNKDADGKPRVSAKSTRPYVDYFNETFVDTPLDGKATHGYGFGAIGPADEKVLANVRQAIARQEALAARYGTPQSAPTQQVAPTEAPVIGDMTLGGAFPRQTTAERFLGNKQSGFGTDEGVNQALEIARRRVQGQRLAQSQPAPAAPSTSTPALPMEAFQNAPVDYADQAPTESEMLAAIRRHYAASIGAQSGMFNIRGVERGDCTKLGANQYRCSYRPDLAADCDNPVNCLIALTPRGWNTAVFTRLPAGWSFGGAE